MLKFLFLGLIGLSLAGGGALGIMAGTGHLEMPHWGGHHMGWDGDDDGWGCGHHENDDDRHFDEWEEENGAYEECWEEHHEWCEEYEGDKQNPSS